MHITESGALLALASLVAPAVGISFTCQPGQSCWPSLQQWNAFNKTVSGRLKTPVMLASPCFPSSPNYDPNVCTDIKEQYGNGTFRDTTFGSTQFPQWEQCGNENCYPGFVSPQGATCSLGRISPLYIDAEGPSDINATIAFAKQHGIRIVLKNTGHDYLGRSASANTLGLRTHNMKNMTFKPSFSAQDCPAASNEKNIGIIGAGVSAEEAIAFFNTHGMMITMGACHTVGIAGGYGQAGGHGPLGPSYGLMVDQAVEFDVVTADGVFRTINACNEPDLFWAMRGGGGQSYAVLVNYKFQVYPQTQWATWLLNATLTPPSSNITENTVLRDVLTSMSNEQETWTKNHIAGYNNIFPTSITLLEVLPAAGDPLSTLKQLTASFNSFLASHPGVTIIESSYQVFSSETDFFAGQNTFFTPNTAVGVSSSVPSRLITVDNFESASKIDALVSGILNGLEAARVQVGEALADEVSIFLLKTSPFNTPDATNATSANPAWRKTLWHLVYGVSYAPGTSDTTANLLLSGARTAIDIIKAPLSVQAAYVNEADPAEPDWQNVFFGENYNKLLAIKQKWDPDTVLNCWKCVGFIGDQDPMYSCYGSNPTPSVQYPFN
ncbi:hypothetical protein ACHAQJ_010580 [Trichoderma viride]